MIGPAYRPGLYLAAIGAFSTVVAALGIGAPLYTLQVFDRVLTSHSIPTLVALVLVISVVHLATAALSIVRTGLLRQLAEHINWHVSAALIRDDWRGDPKTLRKDLQSARQLVLGNGLIALFDAPWALIFLLIMFLLHPWLGTLTACMLCLSLAFHIGSSAVAAQRSEDPPEADRLMSSVVVSDGLVRSFGARQGLRALWLQAKSTSFSASERDRRSAAILRAFGRTLGQLDASLLVALGAYLVLHSEVSFGAMMVATMISRRIATPAEALVACFTQIRQGREALRRIASNLEASGPPISSRPVLIDRPCVSIELNQVTSGPAGSREAPLRRVSLIIRAGEVVLVRGASGTGKTALAQTLARAWMVQSGKMLFDNIPEAEWPADLLAEATGYLPQETTFFPGTVAENIARFRTPVALNTVLEAARAADADAFVQRLPQGYTTRLGDSGPYISPGILRRIALARALYGQPFLLVLDRPDRDLDESGLATIKSVVEAHKLRGGIAVLLGSRAGISIDRELATMAGAVLAGAAIGGASSGPKLASG